MRDRCCLGFGVGLLTLLLCRAGAAHPITTHLDFNLLPNGAPPVGLQVVAFTYAASGVVFRSLDTGPSVQPVFNPDNASQTDFSVSALGRSSAPDSHGFHVAAVFVVPVTSVTANLCTANDRGVVMTAYDVGGAQLGTVASPPTFPACKGFFTLAGIGEIASVVWTSTEPFRATVRVDDLTFTTIPEPGSASLLTLGLVGLALRVHRRLPA